MGEARVVSRVERARDLAERFVGRKVTGVRAKVDDSNVESLLLLFDDGGMLAVDPEVNGDRIMVYVINEQ